MRLAYWAYAGLAAVVAMVIGCAEPSPRPTHDEICGMSAACDLRVSRSACGERLSGQILSDECYEAFAQETCASMKRQPEPAFYEVCWPYCDEDTPRVCIAGDETDTLQACLDGRRARYDCKEECAELELEYTGVCGFSYDGQTSPLALCWCLPPE